MSIVNTMEKQLTAPIDTLEHAFQDWIDAINKNALKDLLAFYQKDAVLIPTLSPNIADAPEKRQEYFRLLFKRQNLRVKKDHNHTQIFNNVGIITGLYTFMFEENDKGVELPCRFCFTYQFNPSLKKWLIITHHSSRMPQI